MGNEQSLNEEVGKALEEKTNFSKDDITMLFQKFKHLDLDGSQGISVEEFKKIPELAVNPLLERVMAMVGVDDRNEVLFPDLIHCLNIFNSEDHKRKLQYLFDIYDIDKSGYITNRELFTVLKKMVGKNLSDAQLQQIVDKTILEADTSGTGKVSFEDFSKILNVDYEKQMAFNFQEEKQKAKKKK